MKGAPWLVAGGTVAGMVVVLGYHTQAMPAAALSGSAAKTGGTSPAAGPSASPSATAPAAGASASGASASGASAGSAAGITTGPNEQFGYGELAVEVTVRGGRITKVTVPSLQTAEPTSQQISDQAISMLTPEVLSAQSLNINAVSGATYTSEAYAQSLQAALDKLHFR
jgi:uncharacterized protein with FMN-binding domain